MESRGGNPYSHVSRGQPVSIKAPAWNTLMDVAQAFRAGQTGGAAGGGGGVALPNVLLLNSSGADVAANQVLAITGPAVNPVGGSANLPDFLNRLYLVGGTPAAPTDPFVITAVPIPNGGTGNVFVSGVCAVKVLMNAATDKYASCIAGDAAKLGSSPVGAARILWAAGASGTVWALVRIGDGGGAMPIIPVTLTVDPATTGAVGSSSTTPGFTYSNPIRLGGGTEILNADGSHATGLSPWKPRDVGMFNYATKGLVYMDASGNPQLLEAYETEQACVDSTTIDGGTL